MHTYSISTLSANGVPSGAQEKQRVPLPIAKVSCVSYLILLGVSLRIVPTLAPLFSRLGVALPLPTRILMANFTWFFPAIFIGAVILTVANQFVPFNRLQLRIANSILVFSGLGFVPLVLLIIYLPMFVLIHRLQK